MESKNFIAECLRNLDLSEDLIPKVFQENEMVSIDVALKLLDLSREHISAIFFLMNNNKNGSAMALLRPAIEAAVRGYWLYYSPPVDQKVSDPSKVKFNWPSFDYMIKQISKKSELKYFDNYIRQFGTLCGFTHGDYRQINNRLHGEEIIFKLDSVRSAVIFSLIVKLKFYCDELIIKISGSTENLVPLFKVVNDFNLIIAQYLSSQHPDIWNRS